jgi:hypothetical protein
MIYLNVKAVPKIVIHVKALKFAINAMMGFSYLKIYVFNNVLKISFLKIKFA